MTPNEQEAFAAEIYETIDAGTVFFSLGEAELRVARDGLAETLRLLREAPALQMAQLVDVTAVDYPARSLRFDVVYHLLSLVHNRRLRVVVQTDEATSVPTATGVFPSAGWFEREVYDLFGIVFEGHPDLRRILTEYGFEGHPLRRDFPLSGFTQVRYDGVTRCVVHEPVSLQQDYRAFETMSAWRGLTDVQKREEDKA